MFDLLEQIQTGNADLERRFASRLSVNRHLNRQLVSYQANKARPQYRWFKYKEGFSERLVHYLITALGLKRGQLLDPFAGAGTTLFAASALGLNSTGIELLPIGCEIIEVRRQIRGHETELRAVVQRWIDKRPWKAHSSPIWSFPHLRITAGAFPAETERQLAQYMTALSEEAPLAAQLLRFAALCILEDISFTRKDGQYLRWDHRSQRRQGSKPFDKGFIPSFDEAIIKKLSELDIDLSPDQGMLSLFPTDQSMAEIEIIQGSSLEVLPQFPEAHFDALITSPPYLNRYDYTRTYALELALLGVDEAELRALRQEMISCTVENRSKQGLVEQFDSKQSQAALAAFAGQSELQSILTYLEGQKAVGALNNAGIPRMVRNYFFEMALIIFEAARVLRSGSPFVMVNDNVRYSGIAIPVDLILSDFAERAGFDVEAIWVLPTGKGNSSQQMGMHGREELRKCVYIWRRQA